MYYVWKRYEAETGNHSLGIGPHMPANDLPNWHAQLFAGPTFDEAADFLNVYRAADNYARLIYDDADVPEDLRGGPTTREIIDRGRFVGEEGLH